MTRPDIVVGQLWRERDKRMQGRIVEVIDMNDTCVTYWSIHDDSRRWYQTKRLAFPKRFTLEPTK